MSELVFPGDAMKRQIIREALDVLTDGMPLPFMDTYYLLPRAAGSWQHERRVAARIVLLDALMHTGIFGNPPRPLAPLPQPVASGYLTRDLNSGGDE